MRSPDAASQRGRYRTFRKDRCAHQQRRLRSFRTVGGNFRASSARWTSLALSCLTFRKNEGGLIINGSSGAGLRTRIAEHQGQTGRAHGGVTGTNKAFARMIAASNVRIDDVVRVIYNAGTGGTDRLRYLIDNDSRGFIRARRVGP
jgi:hypothetical protein